MVYLQAVLEKVFLQVDRKRGRIEDASSAGEDLRATQRLVHNDWPENSLLS